LKLMMTHNASLSKFSSKKGDSPFFITMKKILIILGLMFGLFITPLTVHASPTGVSINSMSINMDVNENGLITVDQTMVYNFEDNTSHGPVVWIPQSYDMSWNLDGESVQRSYYFPVRNISVDGPYHTETDSYDNLIIYIGDADVYVSGIQTYHFSYTMQLRDLDLDGIQVFYQNIVGQFWTDPIGKVDFSITLPKGWPYEPVFYAGAYGSDTQVDVNPVYSNGDKTLSGSYDFGFSIGEGITVYEYLSKEGTYFTFIPPTDYTPFALIILVAFTILLYLVFLKFGKDDKPVITVEFNPIPGLSSSQAGYIYDGSVDTKDVVSLIIEWANKGYLDITEDPNNKDNFTLTKLKDMDESEIRAEKTLFKALFNGRTSVTNKQLQNSFYQHIANAKADIARYFNGNPQRTIFSKKATVIKILFGIVTMIPAALIIASAVYFATYREEAGFMAGIAIFVTGTILVLLWSITAKRWPSLSKVSRFFSLIGCLIVSFVFAMIFLLIAILNNAVFDLMFMIKMVVTFGLSAVNIALVAYMDKRTELGVDYLGKILGLKQFIETAEKDRLEMLVKDDPSYFYKLLPYAYVFNVTDVWSKKFESIAIEGPSWYHGTNNMNTFLFMNRFNNTMSTMNRSMTSVPQSRGSGGGSFGGGGGGFSGGGFGGGGGGHW
jgi:uncharacterized membrane protein YgcG